MMSPYIIDDEADRTWDAMHGYALMGRRCIILCKAMLCHTWQCVGHLKRLQKVQTSNMRAIDGSEQANNKDVGHVAFCDAVSE